MIFPNNASAVTVEPYDTIILWADNDPEQGATHVNFKLDRDGETVGLYHIEKAQWLDLVEVPFLPEDHAFSFQIDPGRWIITDHPTPGEIASF